MEGHLGPIEDLLLLDASDPERLVASLRERAPRIRRHAQLAHDFTRACERYASSPSLEALRALEASFADRTLTVGMRTRLMVAYRSLGSWADVRRVYEAAVAADPDFERWEIPREYWLVSLNKLGETVRSVAEGQRYVRDLLGVGPEARITAESIRSHLDRLNGESLAALGKAFRLLAQKAALADDEKELVLSELGGAVPDDLASAALEISTRYYRAGFQSDFDYYPGINLVYNLLAQGQDEQAESIAPMVRYACSSAGGAESRDYFVLATLLELALIRRDAEEALRLLPLLLRNLRDRADVESTLDTMARLGERRRARAEDTRALDHVLETLRRCRSAGTSLPIAEVEIERVARAMADALGLPVPATRATAPDPTTQRLLESSLSLRGIESKFVGGNVSFGGQVPDRPVTRASVQLARELLRELGLDGVDDLEVVIERCDRWLQERLGLEDRDTGERPKEDLHCATHRIDDAHARNKLEYAQAFRSLDNRTDLMLTLLLGHGDCRDTGAGLPFIAGVWATDRQNEHLRAAYSAVERSDSAEYLERMRKVEELSRSDLRKADLFVWAPILTAGADDAHPTWGAYHEIVLDGGQRQSNPSGVYYLIENHTVPLLLRFDANGVVARLEIRDPWYKHKYPWERLALDPHEIHDRLGFRGGEMAFTDELGRPIPTRLTLAAYSGAPLGATSDEAGQLKFAGMDILPAPLAHFHTYSRDLRALTSRIGSLELTGPRHRGLCDQLARGLDRLGERALERVRAEDSPVAAAHPDLPLAPSVREQGEAVVPPMLVALYLADFRRGEFADDLLAAIAAGDDAEALADLLRLLAIARVACGLVYGERAAARQTLEMKPTGATITLAPRADFRPFVALQPEVAALDEHTLRPAAQWLLAELDERPAETSGRAFLEAVLTREIDAAAASAHESGWKRAKDADLANPDNPFLGWAEERVLLDEALRAMSREPLARRLGISPAAISDAKLAAIRLGKDGALVTHPLYKPYAEALGDQPDGGSRLGGQNALALLTLSRLLLDKLADRIRTVGELQDLLARLLDGREQDGIRELSIEQHMFFLCAQAVYGERGVETQVPALAPTGRVVETPARSDFVSGDPARRAADALLLRAAAAALAEALG